MTAGSANLLQAAATITEIQSLNTQVMISVTATPTCSSITLSPHPNQIFSEWGELSCISASPVSLCLDLQYSKYNPHNGRYNQTENQILNSVRMSKRKLLDIWSDSTVPKKKTNFEMWTLPLKQSCHKRKLRKMSNSCSHTHSKGLSIYRTRAGTHAARKIGYSLGLFGNK